MSLKSSTTGNSARSSAMRDPWDLLTESLRDLILTALVDGSENSQLDLGSLYLAKSSLVSGEKLGGRYFMHFDLHVKDQEQAADVAQLRLQFAVNQHKVHESC